MKIQTKRLELRHLKKEDLTDFLAYRSLEEVCRYQGFEPFDEGAAATFLAENETKKWGVAGQWIQYAIVLKASQKLIGDFAIQLDEHDIRIAQIGITLSPDFQGKGFAKECMQALVHFLFTETNTRRIQEIVDAENAASIRLLESTGFRKEGHFIENIFFKGKWGSEMQYALLKKEWESKST